MRYIALFLILVFGSMTDFLFAEDLSADKAVRIILDEDTESINEAVEYLADRNDPTTLKFIEAAVSNTLYRYQGEALSKTGYSYYKVYPEYEPFTSPVDEKELYPVKLSRASRLAFNKIMPLINITSSDKDKRIAGYLQIAGLKNSELLPILKEALTRETEEEASSIGIKSFHALQLLAGDSREQEEALSYFSDYKNAETQALLNDYLKEGTISAENQAIAEKILKKINRGQWFTATAQNLFSGLSLGSILFLVALGLSIIYGLAGIINMSHREFIMIGAYTTYCMQQLFIKYLPQAWLDASFFISIPMAFIVTGLVGLILERLIIRHLYGRPQESLLATWGISLILIQIARNIFGDLTSVKSPSILSGGLQVTEELVLPYNRLFIIALSVTMFVIIYLVFQKSRLGIKIRAVTQNRQMSACVGISTKKIDALTFVIGSGLAGVAGCAITLIGNVVPNMGQTYIVDSFLVVVIGGVGKLIGCVVSGLGIGVLSKIFEAGFEAVYGKVLMLVLIIVFLQYKPKGLFPDKGRIGDD